MKRNGNSANFFSYVSNGKKSKELFASTFNEIPISVRCVSSIIVVLYVIPHWIISEKRRSPTRVRFLLVETHKRLTSIAVLTVHVKMSLLYIFQKNLCKLIKISMYGRKKHPFTSYTAVKHPKCS